MWMATQCLRSNTIPHNELRFSFVSTEFSFVPNRDTAHIFVRYL